jgi:SAM-dependent methyltransferase
MKNYDKEYFETLNYSNYIDRSEKYYKTAEELEFILKKISLIDEYDFILDYGCGFGFLIEGFKKLGYESVFGYDISQYAVEVASGRGNDIIDDINKFKCNILITLDVFEHMEDKQIRLVLKQTDPGIIIVRIPVKFNNDDDFYLDVSRKDKTHINCKSKKGWKKFFKNNNYKFNLELNLFSIYDSPGVMCLLLIKEK